MQPRLIGAICAALLATALDIESASAARLAYVVGTLVAPPGANEGDELAPGTLIQAGTDALVMVEDSWPAEKPDGFVCIHTTVFGYGASYIVAERKERGPCPLQVPDVQLSKAGKRTEGTRLVQGKYDRPGALPAAVVESQAHWQAFDGWVRNAQRSFTGVVTAVDGSTIRLRSPRSSKETVFFLLATTLDTPVPLDKLINEKVRVDYRASSSTPRAERITMAETR